MEFLKGARLLNTIFEHSRPNLVSKTPDNFIFRMLHKLVIGRGQVYPDRASDHHILLFIFHLRLTSHPRSILFLLGTGTVGTSRGDAARMLKQCAYQMKRQLQMSDDK